MWSVLLIGAMEEEIKPIVERCNLAQHYSAPYTYYAGTVGHIRLFATVCKVGKVAMASCAQHFITLTKHSPLFKDREIDAIINIGVAGGFYSELKQGDIVVASKLCQHDMDVTGLGYPLGKNPDYDDIYIDSSVVFQETFANAYFSIKPDYKMYQGIIASGDMFVSSSERKDFIVKNFDAMACEMEGAALAQVCEDNCVPFAVLRAISDLADGEAPLSYEDFKTKAIENFTDLLMVFFEKLQK